jgi:hypothetical protein
MFVLISCKSSPCSRKRRVKMLRMKCYWASRVWNQREHRHDLFLRTTATKMQTWDPFCIANFETKCVSYSLTWWPPFPITAVNARVGQSDKYVTQYLAGLCLYPIFQKLDVKYETSQSRWVSGLRHRRNSKWLESTMFRKLDLFPSSGEGGEDNFSGGTFRKS